MTVEKDRKLLRERKDHFKPSKDNWLCHCKKMTNIIILGKFGENYVEKKRRLSSLRFKPLPEINNDLKRYTRAL